MTRIARSEIRCRLCGSLSRHRVLLSSNTLFGTDDLDGRPPGMLRRTMKLWVQRCPECGYCATDLSNDAGDEIPVSRVLDYDGVSVTLEAPVTAPPSDGSDRRRNFLRSVLKSSGYQGQLHNRSSPKLANSFLCQSLLAEAEERYVDATFGSLHAAWACDDATRFKRADYCRARVIDTIHNASRAGQSFGVRLRSREGLLADALRRLGNYESAAAICREALVDQSDEFLRNILKFQLELINRRYTGAYSLGDAARWSPSAWGVEPSIHPSAPRKRSRLWARVNHYADLLLGNA
jgi:hypothetical protein